MYASTQTPAMKQIPPTNGMRVTRPQNIEKPAFFAVSPAAAAVAIVRIELKMSNILSRTELVVMV
jgi:hypothetical protein